jgi:hypothetical protein
MRLPYDPVSGPRSAPMPENTPEYRLINQKQIQKEFGIPTRDVIRWCMSGACGFPKPIRIIGRVYIFHRKDILEYFRLKD